MLIIVTQYEVDTPAELCRYLGLDSGSMTRMLDRLEQKGLILRNRCPDDRRQVRLGLTADGQRLDQKELAEVLENTAGAAAQVEAPWEMDPGAADVGGGGGQYIPEQDRLQLLGGQLGIDHLGGQLDRSFGLKTTPVTLSGWT